MTNNLSAGTRVKALDFPRAWQVFMTSAIDNISATTYTTGTPEVAVRFMAPSTGRVAVSLSGGLRNNAANTDRLLITYEIFEGDPSANSVIQSPEAERGVSNPGTQTDTYQYQGSVTMVDGLTPGTYYYARVVYRTTSGSGTADLFHRGILVWPIP